MNVTLTIKEPLGASFIDTTMAKLSQANKTVPYYGIGTTIKFKRLKYKINYIGYYQANNTMTFNVERISNS